MDENTPGVIAQARAAAPVAGQQPAAPAAQPQPAPQPVAPAAQPGFGAPAAQSGFAPQTYQQPAPAPAPEPAMTDRTQEQFSKLTESNQRLSQQTQTLAQQNEQLRQEIQRMQGTRQQQPQQQFVPQAPQMPGQPQQSAMPKLDDYIEIDPRDGSRYVNEAKFNAAVADIYQRASRAEQVAQNVAQQSERREIDRQTREAFTVYPQLNQQAGNYDARFAQQTRAIVYDSLINPQDYGGRPLGFKEAADFIAAAGTAGPQRAVATAAITPQVNEANQVQKEQAAAAPQATPQQVSANVDVEREYQRQVIGTRLGSDEALAVRLLNAPHRVADIEGQA